MFLNQRMSQGAFTNPTGTLKFLLISIVLLCTFGAILPASPRIVAIGDVHGDLHRMTSVLEVAGIIDSKIEWTGKDSILISTGDFTDRGLRVREVMDHLIRLEKEAKKSGGKVVVLFGNHEMMNLTGDLRYVPSEVYLSFSDKKSEKLREDAFKKYLKIRKKQAEKYQHPLPVNLETFKSEWMENHPLGYIEYRKALGPKGKYGKWLRKMPVLTKIDDTIFVHGGLHPEIAGLELKVINDRMAKERKAFDDWTGYMASEGLIESFFNLDEIITAARLEYKHLVDQTVEITPDQLPLRAQVMKSLLGMGSWLSNHPNGPLWYRGYSKWSEEEGFQELGQILSNYSAKQIVVGHTIASDSQITQRFEGRAIMIDTVDPTALEIEDGLFTAIYLDKRQVLDRSQSSPAVAAESSFH